MDVPGIFGQAAVNAAGGAAGQAAAGAVSGPPQLDAEKLKRNVWSMIQQNAPVSDIDAYLTSQGVDLERLKREGWATVNEKPSLIGDADRRVGELQTGIEQGFSGLLSLPGTAKDLVGAGADWVENKVRSAVGAPPIDPEQQKRGQAALPDFYPRYDQTNKIVHSTMQDVGAAMLPAMGATPPEKASIVRLMPQTVPTDFPGRLLQSTGQAIGSAPFPGMMGINLTAGAGGGILNQLYPDKWWSMPAGQLAGGGVAGLLGMLRSNPAKMLGSRLGNMTADDWARAQSMQDLGKEVGVPLMGHEAIAPTGAHPIAQLAGDVGASRQGGQVMSDFAYKRLQSISDAGKNLLDTVYPGRVEPNQVGLTLNQAAESAVKAPKQGRADAARPFFDQARTQSVPQDVLDSITQKIDAAMTPLNPTGQAYKTLSNLKESVIASKGNVGMLDEAFTDFNKITKAAPFEGGPVSDKVRVAAKPVITSSTGEIENAIPSYATAQSFYKGRPDIGPSPYTQAVDAVTNSPVGVMAKADPGLPTVKSFNDYIFNPGNARPEQIRTTFATLNQQNPMAAAQAARLFMENALSESFARLRSGPNPTAGAKFSQVLTGDPIMASNMKAVMDSIPSNSIVSPTVRYDGFKKLMQVLDQTGVTPAIGSPTTSRGLTNAEAASGGLANAGIDAVQLRPLNFLQRMNQEFRMGKSYSELAKIFTDPDSVGKLRELTLLAPDSARARALAAELLGMERLDASSEQK